MNNFEKAYKKIIAEANNDSDDFYKNLADKFKKNGFDVAKGLSHVHSNPNVFSKDYKLEIEQFPYYVTIEAGTSSDNGNIFYFVKFLLVDKYRETDDNGLAFNEGIQLAWGNSTVSIEDAFKKMTDKLFEFTGKLEKIADNVTDNFS